VVENRKESEEVSRDASGRIRWGRRAAGLLIQRTDTAEILLLLRSEEVMDPGLWGIPGGRVEPGETDLDAAFMESEEEVGKLPRLDVVGEYTLVSGDFTYSTFHVIILGEYAAGWSPVLNWESDRWAWFSPSKPPKGTHPGVLDVLKKAR
jgi:8-oxo-dGTP pyrophosphatase MutT (NUDIX family)